MSDKKRAYFRSKVKNSIAAEYDKFWVETSVNYVVLSLPAEAVVSQVLVSAKIMEKSIILI